MISSTLFGFAYLDKIVDFLISIDNTVLQKELGRTNVRIVTVGIWNLSRRLWVIFKSAHCFELTNSDKLENSYSGKVSIAWNYVNLTKFKLTIVGCFYLKTVLLSTRAFFKRRKSPLIVSKVNNRQRIKASTLKLRGVTRRPLKKVYKIRCKHIKQEDFSVRF